MCDNLLASMSCLGCTLCGYAQNDSPAKLQSVARIKGSCVTSTSLMVGDVPGGHATDKSHRSTSNVAASHQVRENLKVATPPSAEHRDDDDSTTIASILSKNDPAVDDLVKAIKQAWQEDDKDAPTSLCRNVSREECAQELEKLLQDRAQLVRILIARKHHMDACVSLFFEQVRFRVKWKPQSIQPEEIPNALPSGAWRLCGYNKEGIVLSNYKLKYWKPGNLGTSNNHKKGSTSKAEDLEDAVLEYTKYVVYMIEMMIANMKAAPVPQKFAILFDLEGFKPSLVFRKDVRLMIRKLIYVAQAQYPERLHKVYLLNAPFGFESAWRLVHPLLDEKTAAKILFAKVDSLTKEIDVNVLSQEYGGKHASYPIPR